MLDDRNLIPSKLIVPTEVEIAALFDIPARTPGPRCRMCANGARWDHVRQAFAHYCAGGKCINRSRICQRCDAPFDLGVGGAGTKYCSAGCKVLAYQIRQGIRPEANCAWCDKPGGRAMAPRQVWPHICPECLAPLRRVMESLKRHHVDHERARRLLTDPGCEICGRDMLADAPVRLTGLPRSGLVVDHDHNCCPSMTSSCGRCVRGFLCVLCNAALGMVKDDPNVAMAMARYLAASRERSRPEPHDQPTSPRILAPLPSGN